MTDTSANTRYYDRLYRKLVALRDNQRSGYNNPFGDQMTMTVQKQQWVKEFLNQQISMIEANFIIPREEELGRPVLADGNNGIKYANVFAQPLKRRNGAVLPTGLLAIAPSDVSTKDSSHHTVVQVLHPEAPTSDSRVRVYRVAKLRATTPLQPTAIRYVERIYVPYALLCEYKATLQALEKLQTTHASVMETGSVRFTHLYSYAKQYYAQQVYGPQLVDPTALQLEGLSSGLLGTKLLMARAEGGYGHQMVFGEVTRDFMGVVHSVVHNGVDAAAPRKRDYNRMLALLQVHSTNISKHIQHPFFKDHIGLMQDRTESRILANTRSYDSPDDLKWLSEEYKRFKVGRKNISKYISDCRRMYAAGDAAGLNQYLTRSRWGELKAWMDRSPAYREFTETIDNWGLGDSLLLTTSTGTRMHHNAMVAFFERIIRAPLGYLTIHDRAPFVTSTGTELVVSASREGVPYEVRVVPPQVLEVTHTARINGVLYRGDLVHTWSDGSQRFFPEPAVIGDYHSSKHLVGYIPTRMEAPYLGVELEVGLNEELGDTKRQGLARTLKAAVNMPGESTQYACCERDGSIGFGFEVVTGHTGLDVHLERLTKIVDVVSEHYRYDGRQGLHIHICKQGASLQHQARMDKFVHSTANAPLIRTVARREANNYSRKTDNKNSIALLVDLARNVVRNHRNETPRDRMDALRRNRGHISQSLNRERYDMLNFRNERTIEFRMFASSKDMTEIMAALEFAYNLWHFCKHSRNDALFTEQFLTHINHPTRRKETKHLRKFLAQHGYAVYQSNPNKRAQQTAVAA